MTPIEKQRASVRKSLRKRRASLKATGDCVDCGKRKSGKGHTLCSICRDAHCRRYQRRVNKEQSRPTVDSMMALVDKMMELSKTGRKYAP
jgi:transcription elongation factor Elf1